MKKSAYYLSLDGHVCQTGAAKGADQAFAEGAKFKNMVNLFIPWSEYEKEWISSLYGVNVVVLDINDREAFLSVKEFHPAYTKLSQGAVKLHARNYRIVNGVDFIICWTPNGKTTGGTGQGILIAQSKGIPIYNLGNETVLNNFVSKIKEMENQHGIMDSSV
jgi:hypothetical protein